MSLWISGLVSKKKKCGAALVGIRNERSVLSTELFSSNIKKSKADFTVREMYISNISGGTVFKGGFQRYGLSSSG